MGGKPTIVGPGDGNSVQLGSIGARFMIGGEVTDGDFALVEHPMPPRALAAPLHRHTNEDEYSYVLEGRMGAVLGDDVVHGEPGDLIFKPRGQWHSFWNAGDEPCRILEIISPAGFERYFAEIGELLAGGPPDPEKIGAIAARYGLELEPESVPRLCEEHGLRFGSD
jgi:mannose-6-phosphate isomerase-like protein (cupin superfamily)